MTIGAPPARVNSATANPNAISSTSCTPAWKAAGTSESNIRVVSASNIMDSCPAVA
nr:hypothetical protein CPGR_06069 [Mycolicibacter nonchromogenicus]